MDEYQEQEMKFDALWEKFSRQVADGGSRTDTDANGRRIITLVARMPVHIAGRLQVLAEETSAMYRGLYTYPKEDMHATILYISPYIESANGGVLPKICDALDSVISNSGPIAIEATGVGVFPTTVFAQLYTRQGKPLVALRKGIAHALKSNGFMSDETNAYENILNWDMLFSNIMRFTAPVDGGIVGNIGNYRNIRFGEGIIHEIELCETDKFLSKANTRIIRKYSL